MTQTASAIVGANIRKHCADKGVNQTTLAAPLRITQTAVSARMLGKTPVDIDELVTISSFLGVPISDLLLGVETVDTITA